MPRDRDPGLPSNGATRDARDVRNALHFSVPVSVPDFQGERLRQREDPFVRWSAYGAADSRALQGETRGGFVYPCSCAFGTSRPSEAVRKPALVSSLVEIRISGGSLTSRPRRRITASESWRGMQR